MDTSCKPNNMSAVIDIEKLDEFSFLKENVEEFL